MYSNELLNWFKFEGLCVCKCRRRNISWRRNSPSQRFVTTTWYSTAPDFRSREQCSSYQLPLQQQSVLKTRRWTGSEDPGGGNVGLHFWPGIKGWHVDGGWPFESRRPRVAARRGWGGSTKEREKEGERGCWRRAGGRAEWLQLFAEVVWQLLTSPTWNWTVTERERKTEGGRNKAREGDERQERNSNLVLGRLSTTSPLILVAVSAWPCVYVGTETCRAEHTHGRQCVRMCVRVCVWRGWFLENLPFDLLTYLQLYIYIHTHNHVHKSIDS